MNEKKQTGTVLTVLPLSLKKELQIESKKECRS